MASVRSEMEDVDGCDAEFLEVDATPDEDLPVAIGGVQFAIEGIDRDGCDVDFDELEATPDEALPAADGGVAK